MYFKETTSGINYHRTWQPAEKDSVKRILIMNLGHIGDFWMTLPALRQARRLFNSAHITLAVSSWNNELAKASNVADEVATLDYFSEKPKAGWQSQTLQQEVSRSAANLGSFDIAIDLRVPDDTRFILEAVRARDRIALYRDRAGAFKFSLPQTPLSLKIKRKYKILSRLGLRKFERKVRRKFNNSFEHCSVNASQIVNYAYASTIMSNDSTPPSVVISKTPSINTNINRTIVIVPFSNSALRDWPFENYKRLIDILTERTEANITLVCNGKSLRAHELASINALKEDLASNFRFAIKDSLSREEFYLELANASLVISNNSGAGHVSAQLGIPTLGIYTASHLPDIWGFFGPKVSMISADVECAGCGLDFVESSCPNGLKCRSMITAEMVSREVRFLLKQFE